MKRKLLIFILVSVFYIASLAVVDGMFNRLVFQKKSSLSYFSIDKQQIYKNWEWKVIGVELLIVLPFIIPGIVAFVVGGSKYILIYLAVFCLMQWDMIFGKIVFDSWFGDTPSMALPYLGWVHINLFQWMALKLAAFLILLYAIKNHGKNNLLHLFNPFNKSRGK